MDINPFTNRWAALGLVGAVMLVVSVLAGDDGVLSRASGAQADAGAAPVEIVSADQIVEAPPVIVAAEPEEDLGLEDDPAFADDEGVVEVISEPLDEEGGGVVIVSAEEAEETEE